jgi:hypothetical protein
VFALNDRLLFSAEKYTKLAAPAVTYAVLADLKGYELNINASFKVELFQGCKSKTQNVARQQQYLVSAFQYAANNT